MKYLFRGFSMRVQIGTDFSIAKYVNYNKIINKHSIEQYRQCWMDRNKKLYNRSTQ